MLSDRVETVVEAEKKVALEIDKAKAQSEKAERECEAHCNKIVSESVERAQDVSKGLLKKNEEEIEQVFKGADVIAEDKMKAMEDKALLREELAVKKIFELIRDY